MEVRMQVIFSYTCNGFGSNARIYNGSLLLFLAMKYADNKFPNFLKEFLEVYTHYASIAPKYFHVPGVPAVTHTHPICPPADGVES